jgi:hypothetical protein
MPLKYWDEAFSTAAYLINKTPSHVINHDTPIHKLCGSSLDYTQLRVFGCACWLNLRPYNTHKLAFKSTRCVFLGYSNLHKEYKCLDVPSGCVYISRDVIFDESVFPFSKLNPNAGAQLKNEIMLLHPTLIPSSTPQENALDNHVNDSHISVESFNETNVSTNPDEGSVSRMQDPMVAENPDDRSQADSLAQVPAGSGVLPSDHVHPWGDDTFIDSPPIRARTDPDAGSGVACTEPRKIWR